MVIAPLNAQNIRLHGKIQDSLESALPFSNIIATPVSGTKEITFAIADAQGTYEIVLEKNTLYQLAITHLGFSKLIDTLQLSTNTSKNFTLQKSAQTLEAVMIEAEMAMIVKEDTITYRVDKFRTGEERKLRELLKNLPGIEVDREGNVTVNGKPVTKLLVEGKQFFTGDEKLGVNNIPANAVAEVTVLDDYHDVPFMKGLSESNQMALNIKLKEDMKKFVFGTIEIGGGIKERYLLHPSLFYYSPKTAVNLIGDFNNIGKKSFTMDDYVDFEGGFSSFLDNPSAYFSLYDSDFAQFLSQNDFISQKNEFAALGLSQEISTSWRLTGYTINSFGKTKTKTTQELHYLTENNLNESRLHTSENDLSFSLNKLELAYTPNYQTDLKYKASVKFSNGDARELINSKTNKGANFIRNYASPKSLKINQHVAFKKQFSYEHTSELDVRFTYKENENTKDWLFSKPVFSGIIPFVQDGQQFWLQQNTTTQAQLASFRLKHYWVLNSYNHIYPVVGMTYLHKDYDTQDFQRLQDGSINSFQSSGFNNALDFRVLDSYIGFEFKKKIGEVVVKPSLVYHHFDWTATQFDHKIIDQNKGVLLPKMSAEYEILNGGKIYFKYQMVTQFSDASNYANRLRLASFNQLYRGNETLENALSHRFSLRYSQANLFKGTFFNIGLRYTQKAESVQNTVVLDGIDQINTFVFTKEPQNAYSANAHYRKTFNPVELQLSGHTSWSDYSRVINTEQMNFQAKRYGYHFKTETHFDNWPNVELGLRQSFSDYSTQNSQSQYMNLEPYAYLTYDFGNFIFKTNYSYSYLENKNTGQINRFQIGDASLFYGKPDSLWGFELSVKNLFNIQYKSSNTYSQFLISTQNIYLQPRTILFKISYKL